MALRLKPTVLGLLLLAADGAQAASTPAGDLYCCQDPATGRRSCGDSLPEQCRGRPYKVLDSAGNVIKEVGPPLTAEQKAQVAAEAERRKQEEAAQREQRRKDQALLATYSSVQDIDQARTRSENDVQEAIKQAEAKIASLRQQRRKFESEASFYRNKPLPPEVAKGVKDNDSEVRTYADLIEGKKADLELIRAKYDEDKRRYLQLSGGQRLAPATGSAGR